MKLYATITSERATKGQGGKYLDINISNEKKKIICSISVSCDEYNQTTLTLNGYDINDVFFDQFPCENCQENLPDKGENQKGEKPCATCGEYGHHHTDHDTNA
jgi:hypothetical protein